MTSIGFKGQIPLTEFEGRHGQDACEHALVVAVQNSADTRKCGNAEDFEVLYQSARTTGSHESLPTLERGVVKGDMIGRWFGTHVGRQMCCLELYKNKPRS